MEDSIVWKEARSHQERQDDDDDKYEMPNSLGSTVLSSNNTNNLSQFIGGEDITKGRNDEEIHSDADIDEVAPGGHSAPGSSFSHRQVNLKLRRNITALADPAQHKAKLEYVSTSQSFDKWIEAALISISPSADIILFYGQSPEKIVFIAKLRMEPINQYSTKPLEIALDYDEQITSLLCLPIMSTQRTSLGSVDWTALVVGLSSGYIKFYTEQSICLLSLKFCDEPVTGLKLQTQKCNSNSRSQAHFASIVDELLISYKTCAIVADGIGLFENLRIAKDDVVKSQFSYEPAYTSTNLPTILTCQRWKFEDSSGVRVMDSDLLGIRFTSKFDLLKSDSMNFDHVSSKSLTRTLVIAGQNPFLSCYREARETTTHSYTEMIGSLLPFWSKPLPSRIQINDINCSSSTNIIDKGRLASSIVPSPDRRLAVVTDDFGRVMLLDATNWLVVRLWKGYRNAQCGWVEVKRNPEERDSPYASFLVIYAPRRGLLEVWSTQRGPRVAAFNVGKGCRLLYAGHKMLNMRAESSVQKGKLDNLLVDRTYSDHCYLLNAKSETVFSIELPYTYSLYKYGDLKSRDRLLISELTSLLQQDSDAGLISETLHRMSLAESFEISTQKIAALLQPVKIIPVMENLIIRIMKNYDNHSGEAMSADDQSIVELCKRLIRLCSMFTELSQSTPGDMYLPDVNRRLIDQYDEHPKEIDEFAEHLGWTATEVLRYLSLLALERSYRRNHIQNPWPNLGEPLAWVEFVSCFDLTRPNLRTIKNNKQLPTGSSEKILIKLKESDSKLVADERFLKTALFMYNRLSESFYKVTSNSPKIVIDFNGTIGDNYTYLDPSSRLILLFQFWLSTKLCNHWKMWAFLQHQVGQISDELKVIVMTHDNDELLIESWKKIYHLILESDNTYAAMIATAAIRSDTIRMISDNEKREKLERKLKDERVAQDDELKQEESDGEDDRERSSTIDWECLCVDAERMSIVSQQLEDVFLLNLLLRYSPSEGHLTEKFVYRVPRISVASILRGGPTIVSELVAQWVAQANVHPKLFTQPYGMTEENPAASTVVFASASSPLPLPPRDRSKLFPMKSNSSDNDEHAKELLHHAKTSYPHSLEPNVVLLNCIWEFCQRWAASQSASTKDQYLNKALDCLSLLTSECAAVNLKHNSACLAYKTFFQRSFERLTTLVETNPILLSPKCSRSRDTLSRRELNMSGECLDDFVQFCFKLSDLMLETYQNVNNDNQSAKESEQRVVEKEQELEAVRGKLLALDEWWSATGVAKVLSERARNLNQVTEMRLQNMQHMDKSATERFVMNADMVGADQDRLSLMRAAVASPRLFDINSLIELNRLTALMMLIFKLKLIKCYPLSLIGEESRQALKLDLQQSPATGADMKTRRGFLNELRHKFARKCIVSIVARLSDEIDGFADNDQDADKIDGEYGGCTSHSGIFGRSFGDGQVERVAATTKDGSLAREDIDTNKKQLLLCSLTDGGRGGGGGGKSTGSNNKQKKESVASVKAAAAAAAKNVSKQEHEQTSKFISHQHKHDVTRPTIIEGKGGSGATTVAATVASHGHTDDDDADDLDYSGNPTTTTTENNESMILFTHLLSLANEWQFNCDELHLELVFELFRCNHDKLASQLANRIQDKQTLANGLLKISSQRVLALFGLSGHLSSSDQWRQRVDKWSLFQPNVSSWLKSIQQEEIQQELANLVFVQDSLKPPKVIKQGSHHASSLVAPGAVSGVEFHAFLEQSLGLRLFVLNALRNRTKLILENVTNYLDGQANRLAYDLLQVLESDQLFEKFLAKERKRWADKVSSESSTKVDDVDKSN